MPKSKFRLGESVLVVNIDDPAGDLRLGSRRTVCGYWDNGPACFGVKLVDWENGYYEHRFISLGLNTTRVAFYDWKQAQAK